MEKKNSITWWELPPVDPCNDTQLEENLAKSKKNYLIAEQMVSTSKVIAALSPDQRSELIRNCINFEESNPLITEILAWEIWKKPDRNQDLYNQLMTIYLEKNLPNGMRDSCKFVR